MKEIIAYFQEIGKKIILNNKMQFVPISLPPIEAQNPQLRQPTKPCKKRATAGSSFYGRIWAVETRICSGKRDLAQIKNTSF
jgi:hypothetical protein